MSPTLPPFERFALVTQLKAWASAVSEPDGQKFLPFEQDSDTFPSTGITDGPDVVFHLNAIIEATTSFEAVHQKTRIYTEALAAFIGLVKAAFPAAGLVALSANEAAAIEKAVLGLDNLRDLLPGVSAAAKDLRAREKLVANASDHLDACLGRTSVSRLAKAEDDLGYKMSMLSRSTTEDIGNLPRPGTGDERTKVARERWDKVFGAEQAKADSYQHYRLLENTMSCIRAIVPVVNMFVENFPDHDLKTFDDAAVLHLDLYGSLYCGDVAELKRLLDEDLVAVAQQMVDHVEDSRFLSIEAFVGADWIRKYKLSKDAKAQWQDPCFDGTTVYGISQFHCQGNTGGGMGVTVDPSTHTLQMTLPGTRAYGEVDYFNYSGPENSAQFGTVVVKPSGNASEAVTVTFKQNISQEPKAVCWLTKFPLDTSAGQGSKQGADIYCKISSVDTTGLQLTIVRPPNGRSEIGVGWLAYDRNAWISVQSSNLAPFGPKSWDSNETASNELWARKSAINYGFKDASNTLPQVVGFISSVRSYDKVQATVQYPTRNGSVVHSETRGRLTFMTIASQPHNSYLDMVFLP